MVTVTIKNYDGTTTLKTITDNTLANFRIISNGAEFVDLNGDDYYTFTYTGTGTFLGFSSIPNGTVEYNSTEYSGNPTVTDGMILYAVGSNDVSVVANYRPLSYTDAKIQVDSAIRDANGVRIDTNYQRKPQVIEYTVPSTVTTGAKTIAEYNGSQP